ncbi:hypothetical protein PRVXH_001554 [Proteinivorax hydrogeniformans]|uniref:Uncharacterized protein n=1 Tax=Proteinivorax hydrogeniformans TaxID=1826727 RepID=A0AAU8HRE6_9FIRM
MTKKDSHRTRFCAPKDLGYDSYRGTEFSHELDVPLNHMRKFRNLGATYSHKKRGSKVKLNIYPSDTFNY